MKVVVVVFILALVFLAACEEGYYNLNGSADDILAGEAKGGSKGPPGKDPAPQCSDGKDNDGDGQCDYSGCRIGKGRDRIDLPRDTDCSSEQDNTEATICELETCDGIDNDCDGIIDEGCPQCGNGIIETGEECDSNNLGGQTCSSLGYSDGSLSCTSTCTFRTSSCCNDACTPGNQRCSNNAVQTCQDPGAGSCAAWTNTETCATGETCQNNQCVPGCTDTCNSLGYQCGTATICGQSTNCGSCNTGETCNANICVPTQTASGTISATSCVFPESDVSKDVCDSTVIWNSQGATDVKVFRISHAGSASHAASGTSGNQQISMSAGTAGFELWGGCTTTDRASCSSMLAEVTGITSCKTGYHLEGFYCVADATCAEGAVETQNCGTNVGACEYGTQTRTCSGGQWSAWSTCTGGINAVTETCDGVDNDCDGTTDEGCQCINGQTQTCGSNVGACTTGTQTCSNGIWGTCLGSTEPSTETCDNIDNDCDGLIDEGLTCTACGNGIKETGEECDGTDFGSLTCVTQGFSGGTLSCTTSCQITTNACCYDVCNPGQQRCSGGNVQTCQDAGAASCAGWVNTEYCNVGEYCDTQTYTCQLAQEYCDNNADDDGDGFIDERDADCALILTLSPNPSERNEQITARVTGTGNLYSGLYRLCDYQGCTAAGACTGVQIASVSASGTSANMYFNAPSAIGSFGYNVCYYQNKDNAILTTQAACGDNYVDAGEQCDGNNLGGATCQSQGYDGGSLSCTGSCTFNTASCTNEPGGFCGINVTFTEIARTGATRIPGTTATFSGLGISPGIDQAGEIVFSGGGGGVAGVYTYINKQYAKVADTNTPIPGRGGQTFYNFLYDTPYDIENGRVAFVANYGLTTNLKGIYTNVGQSSTTTLVELAAVGGSWQEVTAPTISGNKVGYGGTENDQFKALIWDAGTRSSTPVSVSPGFAVAYQTSPVLSGDAYAFRQYNPSLPFSNNAYGIYVHRNNQNYPVAVTDQTLIPGTSEYIQNFQLGDTLANDGLDSVIRATGTSTVGVYKQVNGGPLQTVAENFVTQMPGANKQFTSVGFNGRAIANGHVVFDGLNYFDNGIYTDIGGDIVSVIDNYNNNVITVDGQEKTVHQYNEFALNPNGFVYANGEYLLVFRVQYTTGDHAILKATITEGTC